MGAPMMMMRPMGNPTDVSGVVATTDALDGASPPRLKTMRQSQNWICDETLFRLLNAHYPHLKKAFNFTREGLNRTLSAKAGPITGPNVFGLFVAKIQSECPYSGDKRTFTGRLMANLQQIQLVLWI